MITSFRLFLAITLIFLCLSCQKEMSFETSSPSGSVTPGGASGALRMKINGVQWTADKAAAASIMNGITNISGVGKDRKYFTISLTDTVTGTYMLYGNSNHAAALTDSSQANANVYATNQSDDSTLAGGTVTVTAIDKVQKTISGTFKFKMFRQQDSGKLVITEGVFDKLPYATALQPTVTSDTFYVKIDGVLWTGKSVIALATAGSLVINATELNISRAVAFQLPENITAGSYDFSFGGNYSGIYLPNTTTALTADAGKLTVLEHNLTTKRIRANFNFKAVPLLSGTSYNLTEGYFSIKTQ